ncbi:hypothetical protein [Streptomyces sp. NPDC055189]
MTEYKWPEEPEAPSPEEIRQSWSMTVEALPVGTPVTGRVIGRQPFGVFIRIEGVPGALGLAEIPFMPPGWELPALGAAVAGEVVWLESRNGQVKIKLDEWKDQR